MSLRYPDKLGLVTALPKKIENDSYVMTARDVQHIMDSPWMTSPELWHAEYEAEGVDFHIWSYGCAPPNSEKFVVDHKAFLKPKSHTSSPFQLPSTTSSISYPRY